MKRRLFILGLCALLPTGCGPATSDGPSSAVTRESSSMRHASNDASSTVVARPRIAAESNAPLTSSTAGTATSEAPMNDDYAAALAVAERENKPMLLIFTADWCEYSRRLQNEVLTHQSIRQLAGDYVCVRIDVGRHRDLCEQYRVRAYPTIISASSRGAAWHRVTGAQTVRSLSTHLAAIPAAMAERRNTTPEALTR